MSFLQALLALPQAIAAINDLIHTLERVFGPNWPEVIEKTSKAYQALKDAKTDEEIKKAVELLQKAR